MARLRETALRRLDEARDRADALSQELSDPAIFEDARRAAEVGSEQAELSTVVEHFDRYRGLLGQLGQADGPRQDGADEDMQALAREEIDEIEPQIDSVIASLQEFLR